MNIALGTILIFLFVLPGFAFRQYFFSTPYHKINDAQKIGERIIFSTIPTLLIHFINLSLIKLLFDYEIDLELIGNLFLNKPNQSNTTQFIASSIANIKPIIVYNIWVNLISYFTGGVLRDVIRFYGLDIKFKQLRFSNKWTYILLGESLQFPERLNSLLVKYAIDITEADVFIIKENESLIYTGQLMNFHSNSKGVLEDIILYQVKVKEFEVTGSSQNGKRIPNTKLIIPLKDVTNFNLRFISIYFRNKQLNDLLANSRYYSYRIDNLKYAKGFCIKFLFILVISLVSLAFLNQFSLSFTFVSILLGINFWWLDYLNFMQTIPNRESMDVIRRLVNSYSDDFDFINIDINQTHNFILSKSQKRLFHSF